MLNDACERLIPATPQQSFEIGQLEARALLERIGSELRGRVYVHQGLPFNWLQTFGSCLDLSRYCSLSHAGDCRFARQMLSPNAPWTTDDPSHARLFVVPILLGLSQTAFPSGIPLPAGSNGACSKTTYVQQLHKVFAALNATPWWGKRPHLFFTGGWQTLTGCSRTVPVNGSFIREHCPHNDVTAARRILLRHPRVIAAHFEMGTVGRDGLVTVHDPYVSGCEHVAQAPASAHLQQRESTHSSEPWGLAPLMTAWASPLIERPIDVHFRGRVDHPSEHAVAARARTCLALQRVSTTGRLVCINAGAPHTYLVPSCTVTSPLCNVSFPPCPAHRDCATPRASAGSRKQPLQMAASTVGGACPEMVACSFMDAKRDASGAAADAGYCHEMRTAQRVLVISGDSPSSRQLYEVMELGSLPVVISPRWRDTVSRIVQWDDFTTDLVRGELVAPSDVSTSASADRIAGKVQKMLAQSSSDACEGERRRAAMLKWLPMLSWRLDPYTTSMHVLAQAAQQIETLGW